MKVFRITFLMMMLALCSANGWAQSREEASALFFKGNEFYKRAQYDQAIQTYEDILRKGLASGPVYYNLGNSYFKRGHLGRSILHYSRARELDPRDGDLNSNYAYALAQAEKNVVVQKNWWGHLWDKHVAFYTVDEMVIVLFILFFFFVLAHLSSLYMQWPPSRKNSVLLILFICIMVFVYGLRLKIENITDAGIVLQSTPVKYEPLENATTYFELTEGSRIKILKEESGWAKIEREDGKLGWVKHEAVEKI